MGTHHALRYRIRCPVCHNADVVDVLEMFDEPWHLLEPDPPHFNSPGEDGKRRLPCRTVECEACGTKITLALYVKEIVVRKGADSPAVEDITPGSPTVH